MSKITEYLNRNLAGNAYEDPLVLAGYATDRSALKINPKIVIIPENATDIALVMKFNEKLYIQTKIYARNGRARTAQKLPVSVYGGGNGSVGGALSSGIVISTEKLNKIQEIDIEGKAIRVQAGAKLKEINAVLNPYGLFLPVNGDPDETIGGILASMATDPKTDRHAGVFDFVEKMEVILANGEIIQTGALSKMGIVKKQKLNTLEGQIYRKLLTLIEEKRELLDKISNTRYAPVGYRTITQCKKNLSFDLRPLLFGSLGSLGIVSEVILKCELQPTNQKRLAILFSNLNTGQKYLEKIKKINPSKIELFDLKILMKAAETGKTVPFLPPKQEGYLAIVDFSERSFTTGRKIQKVLTMKPKNIVAIPENKKKKIDFDLIDSILNNYFNEGIRGERVSLFEDFYVGKEKIKELTEGLKFLGEKFGVELNLFGSYLTNNYSLRPDLKIQSQTAQLKMLRLYKEFADLIYNLGGSLVGARAEGRTKGALVAAKMNAEEKELYKNIKLIFDPNQILGTESKPSEDLKVFVKNLREESSLGIKK